jgi:hypothetical protein
VDPDIFGMMLLALPWRRPSLRQRFDAKSGPISASVVSALPDNLRNYLTRCFAASTARG